MIGNGQVEVGTEVTVIIADDVDGQNVVIKNLSDAEIYLGDDGVTVETGYSIEENESIELFLGPGEEIYGIVNDGTGTVCYIATMNQ